MAFNPLRFENTSRRDCDGDDMHKIDQMPKSSYITPGEFNQQYISDNKDQFSILNINIRSIK